jgi:hypothetical protein
MCRNSLIKGYAARSLPGKDHARTITMTAITRTPVSSHLRCGTNDNRHTFPERPKFLAWPTPDDLPADAPLRLARSSVYEYDKGARDESLLLIESGRVGHAELWNHYVKGKNP